MKQGRAVGAGLVAMVLLGGLLLYGYLQAPARADPDFSTWTPGAAAIRGKIGSRQAPTPGMSDTDRRTNFCKMFKERFRQHDPAIAIGLRFLTPTRIKLMCPARMEPFFIDQIALAAWHEARENFGNAIDIDIYDTFIGTSQVKVGELRALAKEPEVAHIFYDFTSLQVVNRPRSSRPAPGVRFRPIEMRSGQPTDFNQSGRPVL